MAEATGRGLQPRGRRRKALLHAVLIAVLTLAVLEVLLGLPGLTHPIVYEPDF